MFAAEKEGSDSTEAGWDRHPRHMGKEASCKGSSAGRGQRSVENKGQKQLRGREGTLTRPIWGKTLKETGTISPMTRIVQESFRVHSDHGHCSKNWVL